MKRLILSAVTAAVIGSSFQASALKPKEYPDTFLIPSRAIIATGDPSNAGKLVAVLYDTSDLHFNDPSAPRFLFLDRKGKVALGIGGYIKGTVQYDFNGAIDDGASFTTYDIPVPANPALKNQFFANASHSTLFLQLAGKSDKFGIYQVYIQTNFTGDSPSGYGLKLKQAYLKVGYVTAGLANSTFVDGAAGTPGVDDQGPAGELGKKNMLVRYAPRFSDHFSGAIGVEMPSTDMTYSATTEKINQRFPDIPAYIQYEWGDGNSHVRLSGLFRNMSYRDLAAQRNKFCAGWAVQLSGMAALTKRFTLFYQGAYGKGYAAYINDLGGTGFDLVHSTAEGRMEAPKTANWEIGARFNASSKVFLSAVYSQAHTMDLAYLGPDTYHHAQYVGVNGFWNIVPDLRLGVEYLWGSRKNYSGEHGHANRIEAMLQFNF